MHSYKLLHQQLTRTHTHTHAPCHTHTGILRYTHWHTHRQAFTPFLHAHMHTCFGTHTQKHQRADSDSEQTLCGRGESERSAYVSQEAPICWCPFQLANLTAARSSSKSKPEPDQNMKPTVTRSQWRFPVKWPFTPKERKP